MNVQMIWNYYPDLLASFYRKHPEVHNQSFEQHHRSLLDEHYGWPGELCDYMVRCGVDASFCVGNDELLQRKWAHEASFSDFDDKTWERNILLEQIRRCRPDVLWLNCSFNYYGDFVRAAGQYAGKLVTWMGSPFMEDVDISGFSVLLTENPLTLKSKQHQFEQVVVTKPGFDQRIIERMGPVEKKRDVTFVGQISGGHTRRAEWLCEMLASGINVDVFAFVTPGDEPARLNVGLLLLRAVRYGQARQSLRLLKRIVGPRRYRRDREMLSGASKGQVFGLDMYRVMAESHVVVNAHIDVAGDNAGNMRMFECTGIGTCLVTEEKTNLGTLFEPGREVLTYGSKHSLIKTVNECIRNPKRTAEIARAGQMRTHKDHTLERMFNDILPALTV